MKVTRSPTGALIVRVRPGVMEYLLAATALMPAIGPLLPPKHFTVEQSPHFWVVTPIALACLAFIVEWSDFVFDPTFGHFRWKRWRVFLKREGHMPLEAIEAVRVQTLTSGSDNVSKHRVSISAGRETVDMTDSYMTGARSRMVAREIASYLNERGYAARYEGP